jgi:hypothetical protein
MQRLPTAGKVIHTVLFRKWRLKRLTRKIERELAAVLKNELRKEISPHTIVNEVYESDGEKTAENVVQEKIRMATNKPEFISRVTERSFAVIEKYQKQMEKLEKTKEAEEDEGKNSNRRDGE